MIESPRPLRLFPTLGIVWLVLAAIHFLVRMSVAPGGLSLPPLPRGYGVALMATEWALLAAAVLAVAAPMVGLAKARKSESPRSRRLALAAQGALLSLLFIGYAGSWGLSAIGGCFLDGVGTGFVLGNLPAVTGILVRTHPLFCVGLPILLVGAAVFMAKRGGSWISRLPEAAGRRMGWAAASGVVLSLVLAVAGDWASRRSETKLMDPGLERDRTLSEVFALHRAEQAGPLAHLVPWRTEFRHLFSDETPGDLFDLYCGWMKPPPVRRKAPRMPTGDSSPGLIRRPIVPMDQYVSTVDRDRLRRWNVILVILDSFRTDSLRPTGGPREVMPAVEALAREASAFPDCYTPATHTNYAMPAAHSSHYPLRDPKVHEYPVHPPYPRVLIYDILKALGWKTAFFSSANETWHQMVNYYGTGGLDVHFHAKAPGTLSKEEQVLSSKVLGSLDDRVTIGEAMKWIDQRGDAPFYLSLVLTNCHLPFAVPADFPRRFGPASIDFEITVGKFPAEKKAIAKELYANSLAYVDLQLGRLFDHLKSRGEWDRTVVVVTGDHGEGFYEHGMPAHANSVFEELARVPLVIRSPGMTPAVDPRPAELIDIPPSLLHLLGLPPHPSFQGLDLFAPDPRPDRIRYVLAQTGYITQLAAIRSKFKLVRDAKSGLMVLFDLGKDPGETVDVTAAHPEIKEALGFWMSSWVRAQLDYYGSGVRQSTEYPPILRVP